MNDPTSHATHPPEPAPSPHKKRRWLAWLVAVVVVGLLLVPILHKSKKAPPAGRFPGGAGPIAVSTDTVHLGSMPITLDALGTVTPRQTVNVYSQVTGRVLNVHYKEGELVKQGDTLVDIDPRPTQAQLQQAQGALARDKATLDQADINLKRYQEAYTEKAIAQQTVSDQEASLRQTKGTVQNDEGLVSYYKVQLDYFKIVAPISGRIGLRLVDVGNTVFQGSGTTIATITEVSPITTVFSVAEDHLPKLRSQFAAKPDGLVVDVYDRSFTKKLATGRLIAVDNQIDTSTGTVRLRASYPNEDGALYPNQFVNVRIEMDVLANAKLIPTIALQYNGQQAYVYVVKPDQTVKLTNVTVLQGNQKDSAVDGLEPNTSIVTSNFDRITDGAKITVVPGAPPGKPDAGAPTP